MAWNGSAGASAPKTPPKKAVKVSAIHGIIALVVVLAIGAIAYLFVAKESAEEKLPDRPRNIEPKAIALVDPAVAQHEAVVDEGPKDYKDLSREDKIKFFEDRYGTNMPPNIRAVVYHLKNPPTMSVHQKVSRAHIFKNKSDRKIASMLLVKPGSFMLRKPSFDEGFDQDFANNMFSNEAITDEDSQEDKDLKRAVADVKKELAQQVRESGKRPSEIMNGEASAMYELGKYKRELQLELRKVKSDASLSDDDVRDFVTAANQMLEAKGIPGFKMPKLVARQASVSMAEKTAEKKRAKESQKQNR